ncbi:exonuclease [Cupriavidus sp. DB3]|uniref:exonuclease n=1 Tax=Cupriavidus sp. DB3 TaxID=2873259 RepID=UPI001CF4685E|nr:exonuclease [Cupriavidus sp. DB3]MCA7084684.1 exonuclease [Cupriavidus sp. DB3]
MAKRQLPDTRPEIYVSTDVETDGPIPGPHSMLSFASVAMLADKTVLGTFSANLETLPGAVGHPVQMKWWETEPEAWAACRRDLQPPEQALVRYVEWVEALPGKPVFVAFPAGFDFTWMFWYMMRFAGRSPFGWAALDIKTLGFSLTGLRYRRTVKAALPQAWIDPLPHTHVALDDALEQGAMFCNMLAALREREAALAAIAPESTESTESPAGPASPAEPTGTSALPDDLARQG